MIEKLVLEILNEETDIFINNIARELEETHDKWFENFGFPIFGETSRDYHEQVYFQSYLESYTRQMINSIIKRVFDEESFDKFKWPEFEYCGIYNGYTNSECEEKFGFEFINIEKRIGYRYTYLNIEDIEKILKEYGIDTVKIVSWDELDVIEYEDERVKVITIQELLKDVLYELSEDEIEMIRKALINYATQAVEKANSMISLVTLPGFTKSYLYKTRKDTVSTFAYEIRRLKSFYVKNKEYKDIQRESEQLIDKYKLADIFLKNKLEKVFVGTSCFAKSILTSEYLFAYFKKNPMFDYTPIVSGYLKSVEQILHEICVSYKNYKAMKINMNSYTLGKYTQFLYKNEEILQEHIRPAREVIVKCLDSYRIENRNHLFHKDYFSNWERVEKIRENTFFILVVLISSVEEFLLNRDEKILGVLNEDYNELFQKLDNNANERYTIEQDGIEYVGFTKKNRSEGLIFDKNGIIKNKVVFVKQDFNSKEIIISKEKIPTAIWCIDRFGEKTKKIW